MAVCPLVPAVHLFGSNACTEYLKAISLFWVAPSDNSHEPRASSLDKLAKAVATVVRDRAFAKRARDLSQQIKAEDGVGNAVKAIEEHLNIGDWAKSSILKRDLIQYCG
ncbi:MAG: hypothetical protein QNJ32_30490 [Xenococcaceae cyanobacterium MO_167.B27]|nr:hypothetical protein [Xenococcaceae cyanobacterium MO_167.B27]